VASTHGRGRQHLQLTARAGADVYNLGVLYLDASSIIGILDGNPAIRI
jgi:hypothetical protein